MSEEKIDVLIEKIKLAKKIVAFTGAGVSTESNIPDFRSADGLYSAKQNYGYAPETMLSHSFWKQNTVLFYKYYFEQMIYKDAEPNFAHKGLSYLEELGKLTAVVTQNIDGLHQMAGSKNVFELHGSVHRNYCIKCGAFYELENMNRDELGVPICSSCNGIIKPDVTLYEEALKAEVMDGAIKAIEEADMLIIIGTSLVVYPAAGLINYFRGNDVVLINKTQTPYDHKADLVISRPAGEVFKEVMNKMTY